MNQRMSEGITPENNAAVLFWQAVDPRPIGKSIVRNSSECLAFRRRREASTSLISLRILRGDKTS